MDIVIESIRESKRFPNFYKVYFNVGNVKCQTDTIHSKITIKEDFVISDAEFEKYLK